MKKKQRKIHKEIKNNMHVENFETTHKRFNPRRFQGKRRKNKIKQNWNNRSIEVRDC